MITVEIWQNGTKKSVEASPGEPLQAVLQRATPEFAFPCGGRHTCGKCAVEISGQVSAPSAEESARIPPGSPVRLACHVRVLGDCQLKIPNQPARSQIAHSYGDTWQAGEPLYHGEFGVAIDIGTTTVVAYLFHRNETQPRATLGQMNAQRPWGSDVLSRIVYCDEHTVKPLQKVICNQIDQMLSQLCAEAEISPTQLSGGCITGNTTMLHILAGLDPHGISVAPFQPQTLFDETRALPLSNFPNLPIYLPPAISAYIGSDISCSLLATGLLAKTQTALLIDVGTNGEMALYRPEKVAEKGAGKLNCCSTAAGPAFEGANITAGMTAQTGAIDQVWLENGALGFQVIGNGAPQGICGSGLIDAIFAARQADILNRKGLPAKASAGFAIGESGVYIQRKDISELLLAKAAIRAGIDTLLAECAISADEVEQVYLCGGFGTYLKVKSAVGIGMMPEPFARCTRSMGNAAGAGASLTLQDRQNLGELRHIATLAQTIPLSANRDFKTRYVSAMYLP